MTYLISIWFFITKIVTHYFKYGSISPGEVLILFSGLCLLVLSVRLSKLKYINNLMAIACCFFAVINPAMSILLLTLILVQYEKIFKWLLMLGLVVIYSSESAYIYICLMPFLYALDIFYDKYKSTKFVLTSQLDQERALRYDLETVKNDLMTSQEEIIRLTEVHERNRIARDIHDRVGHQLTGTLLALETSMMVDDQKLAKTFVEKAHKQLASGIEMVRATVHDISTLDQVGFSSLVEIIEAFDFCQIDYFYKGDVNSIPTHVYVTLIMNLKESLTNIIKYSKASHVEVHLEVTKVFIRMQVKDNGRGGQTIKEGLGLSNMRQRLQGINGLLSYQSNEGFELTMYVRRKS